MALVSWITPSGSLGTIPEGVFYQVPLLATSNAPVYYRVIAGRLPPGIQINETGVLSGNPTVPTTAQGVPADVSVDTTSMFAIRAYTEQVINGVTVIDTLADRTFTLTVTGQNLVNWVTAAGQIATYYDGVQITDLAIEFYNPDPLATNVVTLIAGALPPGLTLSTSGIISGYIDTITNGDTTVEYSFTLRVSNGITSDVRTFSILVYAHAAMTADNTNLTADNTFITADVGPIQPPIITTPEGNIGSVRSDNFFAFQFTGVDFNGNAFQFIGSDLPLGLTLDPNSGWLYGYIPFEGLSSADYTFNVVAQEVVDTDIYSDPYYYTLTVTGPVNADITWLTNSDLGSIDNGSTSTFYVEAVNVAGIPLQYQLLSGSNSLLPQGLQLLPSGHIAGRVSFDTFALDSGTTTFDVGLNTVTQPTTFDLVHTFTVNAYSVNGIVNVNKIFSITVVRRYNEPYDNLYIQAMPPNNDRTLLDSLLQSTSIFPPDLIYRNDDPNFGIATKVIYQHAYGLTAATLDEYVASLNLNHYWKNLTLGEIKTARALDDAGNVIYEVVYSEVVDDLVNNDGVSVGKEVLLPYPVTDSTLTDISTVYPNSLVDMRTQVIDVVGQISNVLPRWMLSRQANGQTLGFTNAWVIAYTNPGQSGQVAYNIQQQFGDQLNLIDFEVDRYELDNFLTKNWDRVNQQWNPQPPTITTFDTSFTLATWENNSEEVTTWEDNYFTLATWTYGTPPGTIFDGGSLQFIAPVDMYSTDLTAYNKYLLFPKRNIITDISIAPGTIVLWVNQYDEFVSWVNNAGISVDWISGIV